MQPSFFKIDPTYEKREFLRKAWISLAHEDVPLEVFDADFGDVKQEAYHILSTGADYEVSWTGEIGNDRDEYYMDVETYYEQVPYTEYERKYNASLKIYENVPVTKYRKEERQRQVQKKRTVTDWHSGHGEHAGRARSWECVDGRGTFDQKRYNKDVDTKDYVTLSADELKQSPDMRITDGMLARAEELRDNELNKNLRWALPGNHNRGVTYRTLSYTLNYVSFARVPEYAADITFNGTTYTKRALACGNMTMSAAAIPNPVSAEEEKKRLQQQRDDTVNAAKERLEKQAWAKVRALSMPAALVLAASIAASLLIDALIPMVGCFVAGVVMYILTKSTRNKAEETATQKLTKAAEEADAVFNDKTSNYQAHRNAALMTALNKKLAALGLEPATEADFNNA